RSRAGSRARRPRSPPRTAPSPRPVARWPGGGRRPGGGPAPPRTRPRARAPASQASARAVPSAVPRSSASQPSLAALRRPVPPAGPSWPPLPVRGAAPPLALRPRTLIKNDDGSPSRAGCPALEQLGVVVGDQRVRPDPLVDQRGVPADEDPPGAGPHPVEDVGRRLGRGERRL